MSLSNKMVCLGVSAAFVGSLYAGYIDEPKLIIRYLTPVVIWIFFWLCVAVDKGEL